MRRLTSADQSFAEHCASFGASIGCCGCSTGVALRDWELPSPLRGYQTEFDNYLGEKIGTGTTARKLHQWLEKAEELKAGIRAGVEHPFRLIKQQLMSHRHLNMP